MSPPAASAASASRSGATVRMGKRDGQRNGTCQWSAQCSRSRTMYARLGAGKSSSGTLGVPIRLNSAPTRIGRQRTRAPVLAGDALDLRRAEIGVGRREVVVEDQVVAALSMAMPLYSCRHLQPESAFSTKCNAILAPEEEALASPARRRTTGTPKAPSATARSVAARSASLISGRSSFAISP